jgi:hypothetical protein
MRRKFRNGVHLMMLSLAMLALAACSRHEHFHRARAEAYHDSESLPLDKMEHVTVEIRMGEGELRVRGGSAKLMEGEFAYGDSDAKPVVRYSPGNIGGRVTIEEPNRVDFARGENDWDLRLNDGLPTEILTHLGAGNAEMKLGSMALRNIEIHMGVGNLDLDLRGAPKHDYDVDIKGGVGNATVRLPAGVDVVANAHGGIGNVEARGLEKHNGQWVSPVRSTGDSKAAIHLDIRGGVGNIDLIAE